MKRLLLVLSLVLLSPALRAQNVDPVVEPGTDSTGLREFRPNVHPDYDGRDIFVLLHERERGQGSVTLRQPQGLMEAFRNQVYKNGKRRINGYRIRIYSGNSQDARRRCDEIAVGFAASHPDIPVYKSYSNPFFKVTVGDFRTRDEALLFAESISGRYPSAFLVREPINYPSLW